MSQCANGKINREKLLDQKLEQKGLTSALYQCLTSFLSGLHALLEPSFHVYSGAAASVTHLNLFPAIGGGLSYGFDLGVIQINRKISIGGGYVCKLSILYKYINYYSIYIYTIIYYLIKILIYIFIYLFFN